MTDSAKTEYQTLRLEREGAIDWLTLHRPERLSVDYPEKEWID